MSNAILHATKKLAQLPTGWKIVDNTFRLECADGMYCKITRADGGWLAMRYHADGTGSSGQFCETWKEVVTVAHAA